jgi:hypothetical protein
MCAFRTLVILDELDKSLTTFEISSVELNEDWQCYTA